MTNTYFVLSVLPAFFYSISSTFLALFVIDMVGFAGAGVIFSIFFFVNAITDYPTGLLSDWIGHRTVLLFAYLFYSASYLWLVLAQSFALLVVSFISLGLAQAQVSGTLQSWFDSWYKLKVVSDPNQEVFREFNGQMNKYREFIGGIAIILGGTLATFFPGGRRLVFGIQSVATLLLAFIFYKYVTSLPVREVEARKSYWQKLRESLSFISSSKSSIFLVTGEIVSIAYGMTYYWLFLFPIYLGYTGTDFYAGIYRFVLFFLGAYLFGYVGKISRELEVSSGFEKFALIGTIIMHPIVIFVLFTYPLSNQLLLIPLVLIMIALTASNFLFRVSFFLLDKFKVNFVPNEIRNSIYSFTPTFGLLLAIPVSTFIGNVIMIYSFGIGYVFLIILDVASLIFLALSIRLVKDRV